jgi:capsular exopolysaccharide synthesis family protein
MFELLMQRTKETGLATELKTSNIRIIDAAEMPGGPASPNTPLNLMMGLMGGVGLALGLTFFFEYLDDHIKNPDEVETELGLSFFGMVPALFDSKVADPLIGDDVPATFAEAFRSIRSNVLFSSAEDGPKVVVVTSSAPGEGKTLVATNLAVALAQAAQRVLIVDGDMRKPRIHGIFQYPQEPGLSNVLVGNAKASEAVRSTRVPGLWAMTAGLIPPNPSELLGSKRFKDFVGTLSQHFDWVIIDSPPVMAVTDSALVAHVANGVVFVIGSAMTSRHTARRSLDQLRKSNGKIIGAVLNRVDLKHHGYYYSQYYRKEYADYYVRAVS